MATFPMWRAGEKLGMRREGWGGRAQGQGQQGFGLALPLGLTWARVRMNSLDMPNTLSMYDTVSCVFVFVSLSGSSQERLASTPHPHVGGTRWKEGDDAPPAINIQ